MIDRNKLAAAIDAEIHFWDHHSSLEDDSKKDMMFKLAMERIKYLAFCGDLNDIS